MADEEETFNPYKAFEMYIVIPEVVYQNKDLTDTEILCYGAMLKFAGKNDECFPKIKTIAGTLKKPEPSIKRAINNLVKKGLLKKERVGSTKYVYKFLIHKSIIRGIKSISHDGSNRSLRGIKSIPQTDQNDPSLYIEKNQLKKSIKKEKKPSKKKQSFSIDDFLKTNPLPVFINYDLFLAYFKMLSEHTTKKCRGFGEPKVSKEIKKLTEWYNEGFDIDSFLVESTVEKWQAIYAAKDVYGKPKKRGGNSFQNGNSSRELTEDEKMDIYYGKERAAGMRAYGDLKFFTNEEG